MEKKKSILFWSIAFGGPVLLGILMAVVFFAGNSTGIFPVVWMFLPAAAVMIGQLVTKTDGDGQPKLPKKFIVTFLATTVVEIGVCFLSLFMDGAMVTAIGNYVFMLGSILSLIFILIEKKDTRKAYGLSNQKIGKGILFILLFIVTYFVLAFAPGILNLATSGQAITAEALGITREGIMNCIGLPFLFFITFLPYFGEEYGWRYYLMPRLMKKFGGRKAVVILGVIWGLWHVPINLFFYSPDTAVYSILMQVIACIGFSVFFAFAYMKTDGNIWVVTAIHFFNNNIGVCFSGGDGSGNVYTIASVIAAFVLYFGLLALPYIFNKSFSKPGIDSFVKRMLTLSTANSDDTTEETAEQDAPVSEVALQQE